MRKGWKIFWITSGVIAVVGFACCMTALGLGVTTEAIAGRFPNGFGIVKNNDWDFSREPYTGSVDNSETFSNKQINEIDAHISAGELQVLRSDTDEIKIETSNIDSRLNLRYYVEDGELKIETRKRIWGLNGGYRMGTIYLFIPEGYQLDEASFKMGAGNLYIEDITAAGSFDVKVGAGEAEIENFRAGEASLECGAGAITASGLADVEMDVDCGVGQIDLYVDARKEDYSYNIKCDIGEVNIGGEYYSGLGARKTIENNSGKEMDINCGIGEVSVDFNN